ncbi:MAG TPA: amidohydrolase family protein [Acidimicrobiales bacterium]|nr:amidohydrolase family protein [Acidimicrobiales bacterium]
MPDFDLIVRGGTVIDGTGTEPEVADVAVIDGVIAAVGEVTGTAAHEVDAVEMLVTPGWVDVHTHYDGQATWDHHLAPSSWHGVTTVVMGNCGVGFAPVHDRDHDALVELMEGVEDIPGAALHEGLSWNWTDFAGFLDAVASVPHDIDVAAQVPHGALRLHVMGQRGADREAATADEVAEMGHLAREAIEAGALGFTTSRTLNHKTSRGEPTPTLTASADELVGIAATIGESGAGVLQVVSDFIDFDAEFAMLRQMVAESGRPLSVSVAQSPVAPDAYHRILDAIAEANADGLRITGQVATRAVGLIFGLECTLNPFLTNRVYRDLAGLSLDDRVREMRDPAVKAAVLAAHQDGLKSGKLGGNLLTLFDRMFVLTDPPDYEPDPSSSILGRAQAAGCDPAELAYDELIADDGHALLYVTFLNYANWNLDAVGEMLVHPNTVPGLSDGGAHVGTICDGSFPTFLLEHWGRDRSTGRIPVAELVKMHTADTADLVGLHDRGRLAPGYRADVNIIDFAALRTRRPEVHHDLPAGGRRLLQRADGYRHTFVAGTEIMRDGEPTGALPGRLVRGGQPAPN